ncbi:hypothetical protein F4806DRAFT_445666 [Annulohypoxylon nitens]|nr:hypothetical protein F4806DRAFT_445666 [Annulohypoxylon nitens]
MLSLMLMPILSATPTALPDARTKLSVTCRIRLVAVWASRARQVVVVRLICRTRVTCVITLASIPSPILRERFRTCPRVPTRLNPSLSQSLPRTRAME